MDLSTHHIQLSSETISYTDAGGSNPPLIILHGFAFRQGMYPLAAALQPCFRVIIPDLPFATNQEFTPPHTLTNYTHTLLAFIQTLGLQNCAIFGNSVGGTLAFMCCLENPDLFNHLIVRAPLWTNSQLPGYMQSKLLNRLHTMLSGSRVYASFALNLFYFLSNKMSPTDQPRSSDPRPYASGEINPVILSRFLAHLLQVEIEDQLGRIQTPSMILWGANDNLIPSSWGTTLHQILPHSQFKVTPNEYHNIATTNPESLAHIIIEFVSSNT